MIRSPRHVLLALAGMLLLAACSSGAGTTPAPSPTATQEPVPSEAPTPATTPGTTATPDPTPSASQPPDDPLLALELTDVRDGLTFTLAELAAGEGPVLVEPMAIWCSNCRAQQREVVAAHATGGEFTSVSLDVDLSEVPEDLAAYAEREGFDWRFAMADAALYRLLQERFGLEATNPPSTPLIVIESDGTVRPLEFGVGIRSAEQLLAEIGG